MNGTCHTCECHIIHVNQSYRGRVTATSCNSLQHTLPQRQSTREPVISWTIVCCSKLQWRMSNNTCEPVISWTRHCNSLQHTLPQRQSTSEPVISWTIVCCSELQWRMSNNSCEPVISLTRHSWIVAGVMYVAVSCGELQCVAVCCEVQQCVYLSLK